MDKKKLALIHIIKKELKLSEAEYRRILKEATGVVSAKELNGSGFRKLMNYFVRSRYYRINPDGLTIRQKLYIQYLTKRLSWTKAHLINFIHKYYHKASINGLTKQEAIRLIESLKGVIEHHQT